PQARVDWARDGHVRMTHAPAGEAGALAAATPAGADHKTREPNAPPADPAPVEPAPVDPAPPVNPSFHATTVDGRGCDEPPSGQGEAGFSIEAVSDSPGCWSLTRARSANTSGPQASAPTVMARSSLVSPRFGPETDTEYRPSLKPSELPSVETHSPPDGSNATLSGQEIGLTLDLSKPPK